MATHNVERVWCVVCEEDHDAIDFAGGKLLSCPKVPPGFITSVNPAYYRRQEWPVTKARGG